MCNASHVKRESRTIKYCNASHDAFVRLFSSSKTYNNMLQKHYIIEGSMNVFTDDNSATKINLFTNISHKPLKEDKRERLHAMRVKE